MAGLIKHCRDTHDTRHFACTLCGEVFGNNADLCRHNETEHIKLCNICHRSFVSDEILVDHIREVHPVAVVHTQEQMIAHEQAREHTARQLFKDLQRREKKKKKKKKHYDEDDDDDEDDDKTYHPSQDTMTTARSTLSSGPARKNSGMLMRKVTHK